MSKDLNHCSASFSRWDIGVHKVTCPEWMKDWGCGRREGRPAG